MRLAVNGEYGMTVDELMRQIEETERLIVVHRNASYRSFLCQLALRPPGSLLTLGWRGLDSNFWLRADMSLAPDTRGGAAKR
jgi:hypothetical protein